MANRRVTPALLAAGVLTMACAQGPVRSAVTHSPTASASTIVVTVDGQEVTLPTQATVDDAFTAADMVLARGHLLDVDGEILKRRDVDPKITVDREEATGATTLTDGAVVVVRRARDATERILRERVLGGVPNNPEYLLGGDRGKYVYERGEISGKITAISFDEGKGRVHPKAVALTFDDGPDSEQTRFILRVLEREEVPATFFVTGTHASENLKLIERIIAEGHAIGNHSWSHPIHPPFAGLSTDELSSQITRPIEVLEQIGYTPQYFRPPGGSIDDQVVEVAAAHGMRTIMWSIGTGDFIEDTPPHRIMNAVVRHLRPGAIILLHDADGIDTREHSATVRVLPDLIREIQQRGYEIVPLEPVLEDGP